MEHQLVQAPTQPSPPAPGKKAEQTGGNSTQRHDWHHPVSNRGLSAPWLHYLTSGSLGGIGANKPLA